MPTMHTTTGPTSAAVENNGKSATGTDRGVANRTSTHFSQSTRTFPLLFFCPTISNRWIKVSCLNGARPAGFAKSSPPRRSIATGRSTRNGNDPDCNGAKEEEGKKTSEVPLRRPRTKSEKKKGRKVTKLHSLAKNPTGTSIASSSKAQRKTESREGDEDDERGREGEIGRRRAGG